MLLRSGVENKNAGIIRNLKNLKLKANFFVFLNIEEKFLGLIKA
tara:strand:+ start:288 stop:419 length:132 start_codon:yes stop_codon:yes gene_type:complete